MVLAQLIFGPRLIRTQTYQNLGNSTGSNFAGLLSGGRSLFPLQTVGPDGQANQGKGDSGPGTNAEDHVSATSLQLPAPSSG